MIGRHAHCANAQKLLLWSHLSACHALDLPSFLPDGIVCPCELALASLKTWKFVPGHKITMVLP